MHLLSWPSSADPLKHWPLKMAVKTTEGTASHLKPSAYLAPATVNRRLLQGWLHRPCKQEGSRAVGGILLTMAKRLIYGVPQPLGLLCPGVAYPWGCYGDREACNWGGSWAEGETGMLGTLKLAGNESHTYIQKKTDALPSTSNWRGGWHFMWRWFGVGEAHKLMPGHNRAPRPACLWQAFVAEGAPAKPLYYIIMTQSLQ